jgi:chromosome segregation ATPase
MPPENDPNPGPDNNAEITRLRTDLNTAMQQVTDLRGKLKEVNDEAKGHRLNADTFRRQSDDLQAQLTEATTKVTTLADQHKTALEAIRAEHNTALEALRTDLTGKLTEAEGKVTDALTKAQSKALMADLKVAAKDAGMIDLDGMKLLDSGKVELDENGELKNGEALMAALKEAKPFLFKSEATPDPKKKDNTSNPQNPPDPKPPTKKKATEMTDEEYQAARREVMSGRIPT